MLVVLCLSFLICMNGAIPAVTGTSDLVQQKPQSYLAAKGVVLGMEKSGDDESRMRRMGIEVNDYPGWGANNRHTPRPQLGRGCTDC
ncbi:uncharacterized protein LOC105168788 [Sesamum indicum]|uniref:Uncharacterized protein LOC105168788 n=1 Tax=Sesamum indicum TaxID=4182 RepID=A0A6I9TMW2_SESIN|nr:uncharacterized protein LOC105168788 [Sesamum indicum]